MNLRWDRSDRAAALVLLLVSAALAAAEFHLTRDEWQWEVARSQDAAGLYLFFAGPLLLGVSLFSAQRQSKILFDFAPGIVDWRVGPRFTWVKFFVLLMLLHIVVLVVHLATCLMQEAQFNVWSWQPYVRQVVTMAALGALGSLLGSYFRSVLLPGSAVVLLLVGAVAIPSTGVRDFLLVGAGTVDFAYWQYSGQLFVLVGCVAVATVLPTLPWRNLSRVASSSRVVVANLAGAVAAFMMLSGPTPHMLVEANRPESCQIQNPTVCGPKGTEDAIMRVAGSTNRVRSELPADASSDLPTRLRLSGTFRASGSSENVVFTSEMLADPTLTIRTLVDTTAGLTACDHTMDNPLDPQSNGRAAAVLAGWLEHRLELTPATYEGASVAYPEELKTLQSLSEAEQRRLVVDLVEQTYGCGPVDLSRLQ